MAQLMSLIRLQAEDGMSTLVACTGSMHAVLLVGMQQQWCVKGENRSRSW